MDLESLENIVPTKYKWLIAVIIILVPAIGRVCHALSAGGGLSGVWRGLIFGTNVPKEPAPSQTTTPVKTGLLSLAFAICAVFIAGCTTTAQTTTFNTLQTIETTADASYSTYVGLVIKGSIATNSLPQISKAYNDLHSAIALAATLDQSGTNYLVSTNITVELTSLVNLISAATNTK
jgi:hypothetical protein